MSSGRDASSSARKMLAIRLMFRTLTRRPSPAAKKRSRALSLNDRITPMTVSQCLTNVKRCLTTVNPNSASRRQSTPGALCLARAPKNNEHSHRNSSALISFDLVNMIHLPPASISAGPIGMFVSVGGSDDTTLRKLTAHQDSGE
jgi:hypothetical protein